MYISDFIDGVLRIIDIKKEGNGDDIFHLSGYDYCLEDVVEIFKDVVYERYRVRLKFEQDVHRDVPLATELQYSRFSSEKTRKNIAWEPRVNVREGFKKIFSVEESVNGRYE